MTTTETWALEQTAARIHARNQEANRVREWTLRTTRTLRAKRAAVAPKSPPPPANAGFGWKVLEHPRTSHEDLERHARAIWDFIWHGCRWPAGWRVRWGALDADILTIGAAIDKALGGQRCAASLFGTAALGLCDMREKILLIDEANHQGRSARDFLETIVHEEVHMSIAAVGHGPAFQSALASALAVYDGTLSLVPKGKRFGPDGWFDPKEVEYRG
jgi:hypothetical protein